MHIKKELKDFIKREEKRPSIYSQVQSLLSVPNNNKNKNKVLNEPKKNNIVIEEEIPDINVEKSEEIVEYEKEVVPSVSTTVDDEIFLYGNKLTDRYRKIVNDNIQLKNQRNNLIEKNNNLLKEKEQYENLYQKSLRIIGEEINSFKSYITSNYQTEFLNELNAHKDIIVAFSDSSKMNIKNNFENIDGKIAEFFTFLKQMDFVKKEYENQKIYFEELIKNKNGEIEKLIEEKECKNRQYFEIKNKFEIEKSFKSVDAFRIEELQNKNSNLEIQIKKSHDELIQIKNADLNYKNKIKILEENYEQMKNTICEKNKIIEKLPILNLYEHQIREKIDKWFEGTDKKKFKNEIFKLVEDIKKNDLFFIEESYYKMHETFKKVSLYIKNIFDTIEIQKTEIINSRKFYENKIEKLIRNRGKSMHSKKRVKGDIENEENIWKMFELSDI